MNQQVPEAVSQEAPKESLPVSANQALPKEAAKEPKAFSVSAPLASQRQRPVTDQQQAQQHLQKLDAASSSQQEKPAVPAKKSQPSGWADGRGSWGPMPKAAPFSCPDWSEIQLDAREPVSSDMESCTGTGCGMYLKAEARAAAAQQQWSTILKQTKEQETIEQIRRQESEVVAQGEVSPANPEEVDRRGKEHPVTNERWQESPEQVNWKKNAPSQAPASRPVMAHQPALRSRGNTQQEEIDRRGGMEGGEPPIGWSRSAPVNEIPEKTQTSRERSEQIDRPGTDGTREAGLQRPTPQPERDPSAIPVSLSPYQAISSLMEEAMQKAEQAASREEDCETDQSAGKKKEPPKPSSPPREKEQAAPPAAKTPCPPMLEPTPPCGVFPTQAPPEELARFTDSQGAPVENDQNSLTVGRNGPTLLTDTYLLEKIAHFDRERIPERVVHAKGTGAFGEFESYGAATPYTNAAFLQKKGQRTPVFVRFSTVIGGRGSADTARDPRGFATKFYTDQGNFDLVGNSLPVFFIRDAIQFPDLIHALKPDPVSNVTRIERFWDFVSLTPEATHMITWLYSDRGTVSSYRYIDGFSVNTYVLVNGQGKRWYAKFQWISQQGIRTIDRHEAQLLAGSEPDIAVKDLRCAIEEKDYPQYELCIQVMEPEKAEQLEFDPLDDTKTWDTSRFPLIPIGMMTLNRNPDNFFAQVEQSAFCPANRVPGIEFSDDKMLTGRTFSYRDTQRYRLGVNFAQLPVNQPRVSPANYQQDGAMAFAHSTGSVNYYPNSLAQGLPEPDCSLSQPGPYAQGEIARQPIAKTNDFQQAGILFDQFSPVEQQHLIDNIAFELKNCPKEIQERILTYLSKAKAEYGARVRAALWK